MQETVPLNKSGLNLKNSGIPKDSVESEFKLSAEEYQAKYDLQDPKVFEQQGKQLDTLDQVLQLQAIMLKLTDSQEPKEHWEKIRQYMNEGQYFKEEIRKRINESGLS